MPSEKLIELKPGKGLDSGVYPGAEASVGAVWSTSRNAWFRELHIEHMPGRTRLVQNIGRGARSIAQANVAGVPRVYYEDLGIINYYESGAPVLVGALDQNGQVDLEPYGAYLLATDNISGLQLWPGTGALAEITDALTQFATCKIIKRLAQHVLVYGTDVYPSGFHWCSASAPLVWTPTATNSAGNLPIRDLDSDIVAVENLGAAHAVYSQNTMLIVQYTGPGQWFGTPNQALIGIGAVSKNAVTSLGRYNWGMSRSGIWLTEGSSMMYVDRPAVDRWLQENVDWSRASEIVSYHNDKLGLVIWIVPLLVGGITAIAVDPKNKTSLVDTGKRTFSYLDDAVSYGDARTVFNYPITAKTDGLYLESVSGTVVGDMTLESQLFDAGDQSIYKQWDYVMLEGTISGTLRVGFSNTPQLADVEWLPWQEASYRVPLEGREAVFFAIQFATEEAFRMSGMTVYGEKAGLVT